MKQARPVGLSPDGKNLILVTEDGEHIQVPADDHLMAALQKEPSQPGKVESEMSSNLTPREIQTRIRSGESVEQVAQVAGVPVQKIEAFAAPVIAEREHVAGVAQKSPVRKTGESSASRQLNRAVEDQLTPLGVDFDAVLWDSWRIAERKWIVQATFVLKHEERRAQFLYDQRGRFSVSYNDDARWLIENGVAPEQPKPVQPAQRNPDTEPTVDFSDEFAIVHAVGVEVARDDYHDLIDDLNEPTLTKIDGIYDILPDDDGELDRLFGMLRSYSEDSVEIYPRLNDSGPIAGIPPVAEPLEKPESRPQPSTHRNPQSARPGVSHPLQPGLGQEYPALPSQHQPRHDRQNSPLRPPSNVPQPPQEPAANRQPERPTQLRSVQPLPDSSRSPAATETPQPSNHDQFEPMPPRPTLRAVPSPPDDSGPIPPLPPEPWDIPTEYGYLHQPPHPSEQSVTPDELPAPPVVDNVTAVVNEDAVEFDQTVDRFKDGDDITVVAPIRSVPQQSDQLEPTQPAQPNENVRHQDRDIPAPTSPASSTGLAQQPTDTQPTTPDAQPSQVITPTVLPDQKNIEQPAEPVTATTNTSQVKPTIPVPSPGGEVSETFAPTPATTSAPPVEPDAIQVTTKPSVVTEPTVSDQEPAAAGTSQESEAEPTAEQTGMPAHSQPPVQEPPAVSAPIAPASPQSETVVQPAAKPVPKPAPPKQTVKPTSVPPQPAAPAASAELQPLDSKVAIESDVAKVEKPQPAVNKTTAVVEAPEADVSDTEPRSVAPQPVVEPTKPETPKPTPSKPAPKSKQKKRRASVPSWDEIMFGSPKKPEE